VDFTRRECTRQQQGNGPTMTSKTANTQKTVIVTGGSQGIGAGVVKAFLDRRYKVVANSRRINKSGAFAESDKLALVDGNIAEPATATKIAEVAISKFKSIDAIVNQRRYIFFEALHGLHGRRPAVFRFRQHTRFSLHHPARDKADAGTEGGRQHRQYHVDDGGPPDRRRERYSREMVTREGSPPSSSAERRLNELGIKLPPPPEPFGTYVEAVRTGNLLFLTDTLPTEGRHVKFIGRVGAERDVEAGRKATYLAALNAVAIARQHLGSVDYTKPIVRPSAGRPRRTGSHF
jgi:hypothetical protein